MLINHPKFGKNLTISSQDIVQKRKWDTNSHVDANGIRTKNNVPSP